MNNSFSPDAATTAKQVSTLAPADFFVGHASPHPSGQEAIGREAILRRYWRVLLKRRWVIAGVVLAAVLIALAIGMFTQRMYGSTVTIEIAREAEKVVDLNGPESRSGGDPEFYQTQYELLKSRALAEAVVRKLRLAQQDTFLTQFGATDAALLPASRAEREQMATGIVMNNTEIIPVRLSGIVRIRHNSPDPQMAAAIANSLAENAIQSNLARRYEASSYARDFLKGQLAEVRQRLETSERQAVAYAGQNEIINLASTPNAQGQAAQQSLIGSTLASANAALAGAKEARIMAENRYRAAARRGDQSSEALQNNALNAIRQQRATLNGEYQKQLSDFGPEYPAVQALRAQIAELDKQVNAESSRISSTVSSGLEAQYRESVGTERQLEGRVEQLKSALLDQDRRSIQYNIFHRDVDTNRALYDALLQRYKEVGIAGGVGTNNISIVDRATVPASPYKPDLRLNILLALLVGLMLGAGLALILEQLDESAISPDDFNQKLGVALLGSVPAAAKGTDLEELLTDPKSPVSEAYLSVLTGLHFSTAHGTPKSFLVTSTQPGEGKSTTGLALARSLARLGNKVLIIDGDMRNPSAHKRLNIPNTRGFSNFLVGDGTLDDIVSPTAIPNLHAITSGPLPPNPAELLAGAALDQILARAGERYDHIVIDAPPVLGLADAPLLARAVEATIFILESKRTRTSQALQAINRLLAVQAPIAGAVLTKFDNEKSGYGYGYGYDYSYGH